MGFAYLWILNRVNKRSSCVKLKNPNTMNSCVYEPPDLLGFLSGVLGMMQEAIIVK